MELATVGKARLKEPTEAEKAVTTRAGHTLAEGLARKPKEHTAELLVASAHPSPSREVGRPGVTTKL